MLQIFLFQNCSSEFSSNDNKNRDFNLKSDNNGHGYGGKPGTSLFRFVPNFVCADQSAAPEIILQAEDGTLRLQKTNVGEDCQKQVVEFDMNLLYRSPFQNEFFVYNDYLFTSAPQVTKSVPNNLAEALCRDDFNEPKFEVVAHYDGSLQISQVNFFGSFPESQSSDQTVARVFSANSVLYTTSQYRLEIEIPTSLVEGKKRYTGDLNFGSQKIKLTCVLGGGLDIGLFNFRKLTAGHVLKNYVIENNHISSLIALPNSKGQYLFQIENNSGPSLLDSRGQLVDLSKSVLKDCYYCPYVNVNPAKNQFVTFGYDANGLAHLYFVDLDSKTSHSTPFLTTGLQEYYVLRNAVYFFWKSEESGQYSLTKYDVRTQKFINLIDSIAYDFSFHEAIISSDHDKLFIYAKMDSSAPLIVINDRLNTARVVTGRELNLPMAINDKYRLYNVWGGLKQVAESQNMMLAVRTSLDIRNFETDIYFFDTETYSLTKKWKIPAFFSRHLLGEGKFLMGCNTSYGIHGDCVGREDKLLDLLTGQIVSFSVGQTGIVDLGNKPMLSPLSTMIAFDLMPRINRYLSANDFIYGAGIERGRQYAMNIKTKESKSICQNFDDDVFFTYFKTHHDRVYQFSFNFVQRTLSIYLLNGFDCRLQTRVPVGKWSTLSAFDVNEAGILLVFNSQEASVKIQPQAVVFAPFNGRTPILLNSGFKPFASAEHVKSSANNATLYLVGQDAETGSRSIWEFSPY